MIIYILRRLLILLIIILLLSGIAFAINFFPAAAPLHNVNLLDALLFYYSGLLEWHLGISSINGQSINQLLYHALPATLQLCILAFLLAIIIGLPCGIIAAQKQDKWQDKLLNALSLVSFSAPVFWLALLFTLFFSLHLAWLPLSGQIDLLYQLPYKTGVTLIDAWLSNSPYRHEMLINISLHLILPVLTLMISPLSEVVRLTRSATITILSQNYIKAAESRGTSRYAIVKRHILRNTLPFVIPKLGIQFAHMLNLAMIIEVVFNWPGMGSWLLSALSQQDYASLGIATLVMGSLSMTVNIFCEIVGMLANPLKHKEWYALR